MCKKQQRSNTVPWGRIGFGLDTRFLSEETVAFWNSIQDCIKANEQFPEATLESAVNALSSNMSDDVFIRNIQVYYQILRSDNPVLRQRLLDFCTKTLLANHMIPLKKQESNLPLLCTLFYRLFSTPAGYLNLCESGGPLIHDKILSFEGLITIAGEQTTAKPLPISYMQDNPSLLLSAKELMAAAHEDTVQPVTRLHASPLPSAALTNLPKDMVELLKRFRALETTAHAKISKMTVPSDPMQAFAAEASAGKELYALEETQKKLVSACMAKGFVDKLSKSVDAELPNILADKELAWKNALEFANRGPADPEAKLKWAIACESKARAPITKADLLSLYLGANPISSMKKTGLTEEQAITLHDDIHKALVLGIREQNLKKIAKNFKKAVNKNDMSAAVLAFELLSKPEIPLLDEPAMVLFQHEENLTLRPRQVEALHSLLKKDADGRFYNLIEKIIMGGGKSKVLLPILAEKKAQGDNLVVIEVPQSLLHSTYADLNRLSQRLYGKEATLFQFNRDTPCAPADLEKLYGCLLQTMVNHGYLLTTGETMQALELKYIELLLVKPEKQDSLWEQQLAWCDKIMSLFKHHGDCIIDEVHQGLWINKKLNYTSRDSMAIDANLIKNALALYSFINKNVLIEAQTYTEQHDWTSFKQKLALTLCRDASSPLKSFITKALLQHKHGNFRALLLAYLTNTEGSNPDEVLCYANDEEKSMLVYFKQEISVLLPQTLTRRLNENYGASKLAHSDREKALAIPYTANNVPNERSRFGNELEAMNYTIQMMLLQGLTKEHIKERIDAWQTAARYESSNDPEHQAMDSTLTAKSFACLVKPLNISLSKADTNHPATLELIYQQLRFNQTLMHEFLQEQVLPQIRQEAAVIHSDAYNHVDIFNTVQGLSGTPHNYRSYHPKLAYDTSLSLGTDMYVFQVMKAKNTQVTGLDYENLSQFVAAALTGPKAAKRRAFIDIGASFKGIGNRAVAEAIATFYRGEYTNRPIPIKHVLYFNDEQRLCALDVANPKEIIVLDSMDKKAINQRLRSKPEERFTYYDQIHTLGIDIQQADDADAAVFVDEKVSMQGFLQGCMRMRKLNQGQSLEIIVPKRLESMNSDALLTSYLLADNNRTQLESSSATKGKLHNFARRTAMNIIQDLGSEKIREKARLAQHFRGFLETIPSSDLVGLYGPISKPQEASEIFKHYKGILLGLWKTGLASSNNAAIPTLDTMDAQLQGIIDKSLDFCLKKYNEQEASPDNQKEEQKEVHKEIQKAVQKLTEAFNKALEEAYRFPWPVNTNNAYQDPKLFEKMTIPVNSVGKTNLFSPNFLMSKNFALTYRTDKPIIDGYSKPVFPIWYHWQGNTLRATLITPEEASELSARIQNTKGSWIAATDNTYLEGDKPPLSFVQDPEYQALREQACYFNGEFSGLVNQKAPWHWLKDRLAEKVAFFETHLLPVRTDAAPEFQALKEISLSMSNAGFAHIAKHPFEDYRNADWQALFPDTLQSHAKQYQKVAEVFSFLNRHWFKDEISLAVLQKKFHLPLQSLTFVNAHIEHLSMLKAALSFLQTNANAVHTPLFLRFPHAVRTALENCVQTSFARMYFNQGFTPETILKPSPEQEPLFLQANFKVLLLLNTHAPLKNHAVLEKLMISIVDKVSAPALLEPLLDNPDLPLEVAMDIASNEHFEIGFCAKLIEHNPHPSLGLVLLRRFGNEVAAMLPLAAMIEQAQKDDLPVLAPLVNSSLLSRAEFTALQRKCKTSAGGLSPRSFGRFFGDELPEEQDDVAEHKHEFS